MPFKKGNKLWEKGLGVRRENKSRLEAFVITLADGGMERYAQIMDKAADGKELTKAEVQYLDRMDGWREYVIPKLARVESKVDQTITFSQYEKESDESLAEEVKRLQNSVTGSLKRAKQKTGVR